jgi:hypothetical protein
MCCDKGDRTWLSVSRNNLCVNGWPEPKAKGIDWSTKGLADTEKGILGKWIDVTGWLLFNFTQMRFVPNSHPGNPECDRASGWEIHPVTQRLRFFQVARHPVGGAPP